MSSASDILTAAFESGRPIVPFLGAGVSVGTGFPSMTAITAYLAKVRFHIRHVARSTAPSTTPDGTADADYLRQYGWPDLNQLNADVWRYLSFGAFADGQAPKGELTSVGRLSRLIDQCRAALTEPAPDLARLATGRWQVPNDRIQFAIQVQLLEMLSAKDWKAANELWEGVVQGKTALRGDWYDLMMSLTEGDFDLVDALFVTLGRGRAPATTHAFLAQLADAFRVRLYLSLNFDPFLETALWEEGHNPNVIEVAKDSDLPSREAIRDRLTVLKLHGGPYGLRIGERIYETADANTLHRAARILPPEALVVVMGFSGDERRITQVLIDHALRARKRELPGPALLWMNYGPKPDPPLAGLARKINDGPRDEALAVRHYADAAPFLLEVLARHRLAHPAGREPYRCLPTRPWADPPDKLPQPNHRIVAFFRPTDWDGDEPKDDARGHSDASVEMAAFCRQVDRTHHVIWVDCEMHHTVDGIVVEILDSIRRYDPAFPPLLMQSCVGSDEPLQRAIERIREALQRGNYVLCIDSPETIGRPQTVHHGTPRLAGPGRADSAPTDSAPTPVAEFSARVDAFFTFLELLVADGNKADASKPKEADVGESFVCVAFSPASPRHLRGLNAATLKHVDRRVVELKRICERNRNNKIASWPVPKADPGPDELDGELDLGELLRSLLPEVPGEGDPLRVPLRWRAMILSVLRRPRSHLAYLALLDCPTAKRSPDDLRKSPCDIWDQLFARASAAQPEPGDYPHHYANGMRYIGGSLLWIPRGIHNRAYQRLADLGQELAGKIRGKERDEGKRDEKVQQSLSLLAAAILHRRAARYYFSEVYEATGDIAAFREYIYHRISYLRSLCRLMVVTAYLAKLRSEKQEGFADLRGWLCAAITNYRHPDPWKLETRDHWGEIRLALRSAWHQELKAFRATLSREFDAVRQQLYAGTWMSIIDRIREFDIEEMYHADSFKVAGPHEDPNGKLCQKELLALREDLDRQELEARFEMADWSGTIRAQKKSLKGLADRARRAPHLLVSDVLREAFPDGQPVPDPLRNLLRDIRKPSLPDGLTLPPEFTGRVTVALPIPPKGQNTPADFVLWFMQLLAMSEGFSRLARVHHEMATPGPRVRLAGGEAAETAEPATRRDEYQQVARRIADRLNAWLEKIELLSLAQEIPPFSDEIQRILRTKLAILSLELSADQARFQFDKFNPWRAARPQESFFAAAKADAIRVFEQARRTVFQDVGTYNFYRAKSLRMVARAEILAATDPAKFGKPIADLNLALRLLHRTRPPDPLEEVACYRAKAEALMMWSHHLALAESKVAARARLDASRAMIERALTAFTRRRRNVPWWLRLCRDRAQWAIQSCVLRLIEGEARGAPAGQPPGTDEQDLQSFEADLRFGLDAIRAGLDGLLPVRAVPNPADEQEADPAAVLRASDSQWTGFVQQWLSLGQAATAFYSHLGKDPSRRWKQVNEEARLPRLFEKWDKARQEVPLAEADQSWTRYAILYGRIVPNESGGNSAPSAESLLERFRSEG